MSSLGEKVSVITDFDGTITEKDVCYMLLERYADFNWKDIDDKWINGEYSTEDAYRSILSKLNLDRNDFDRLIDEVKVDESFKTFALLCKEENVPLKIASDGLDYYIKKILKNLGLEFIPIFSNKLRFEGEKWEMSFPNIKKNRCPRKDNPCGCCKATVVENERDRGQKVVFIGDGASDRCPAEIADYVFAKGYLEKYCLEKKIKYFPFNSFRDIEKICVKEIFQF